MTKNHHAVYVGNMYKNLVVSISSTKLFFYKTYLPNLVFQFVLVELREAVTV